MKKLFVTVTLAAAAFSGSVNAQQDPQFTQWMFNRLIYNPGYAGTSGAICGVAQYRQQWASFPGNPTTLAFSGDMRLAALPLGVGLNVISDKISAINTTYIRAAASYNILRLAGGTLGLGLDIGVLQKKVNDDWVTPEPLLHDPSIPGYVGPGGVANPDFNKMTFDVGLGAFYQIPGRFYAGLSTSHLPAQELTEGELAFKVSRHYYAMAGYTFLLNKWSKLTPNVFYKFDNAAAAMDLNLTYLWSDMIWVGGTYRPIGDQSAAAMVGFQGKAMAGNALGYRIGISYDMPGTLGKYSNGSYELVLGVCYTPRVKGPTTYQTDRFLD
jgi:type IX secretion system PorP/SprF family membrane protein